MSTAKCSKCGKTAAADIAYAGTHLCAKHFNEFFEGKVRKANREFEVLRRGDRVVVAISGGKDSAAMLYALHSLAQKIGAIQLFPVLIDEGIAGYRGKAAEKARKLCKKLGLKLIIISFKKEYCLSLDQIIAKRNRKWSEEGKRTKACSYCGVLRKHALNKAAQKLNANKLAIGHNADDTAQTFLMNLLRNEPQRIARFGLAEGESESQDENDQAAPVPRVRPLIYCTERECALYCMLNKLPFHLGGCPYAGEAFRGIVKDFLNDAEAKYPGVKLNCLRSFLTLRARLASKSEAKKRTLKKCVECGQPSSGNSLCKACELLAVLNKR